MHTSKTLKFDSHSFEAKMITDEDGWYLIVVVDGNSTKVDGSMRREILQDATQYNVGDPREINAGVLKKAHQG